MKLKDYNTTAKIYQLFLQFQKGQFDNSTHGVRYLNKFFNKAKNEPTIISSWKFSEITMGTMVFDTPSTEEMTLKDYIYRICENKHFNDKKFSTIKTEIFQLVSNLTQIPRDLINFSIIMKPRSNSEGYVIIKPDEEREYNSKCNNITEDTIYNNKDYVLTVNITTPLNDLMRFSLFFYQKWMNVIESKRLMQEGYKKTLEKYKSTGINKELIDKNKLLTQQLSNNRQEIKKLNDLINAQKIDLIIRDRFIQKLENKQEKEVNLEFDELISKKDNEIKRLTKENEDFLNLINERDVIIKKQSEQENNNDKLNHLINSLQEGEKILLNKLKEQEDSYKKKEWINDNLKRLTDELNQLKDKYFWNETYLNLTREMLEETRLEVTEFKKISENLAIQNNNLLQKNKYNENLMVAYSNACNEIIDTFEFINNYQKVSNIVNKHIEKIKE